MRYDPDLAHKCASLTLKQHEAAQLLAGDMTTKEIARCLGVSPSAVEQRLKAARDKVGAINSRQLAFHYRNRNGMSGAEPVGAKSSTMRSGLGLAAGICVGLVATMLIGLRP